MDPKATVTSKGQVTIPLAIRQALGLDAGTRLSFELSEGGFQVRPISRTSWPDLWAVSKAAPKPKKPVDVGAANG